MLLEFDNQFTFDTNFDGNNWLRITGPPVYQDNVIEFKQAGAAPYRSTYKQRLVQWRSQSLSQKMFAGLSGKLGTIYTSLTDGVQYDYTSDLVQSTATRVEVYPVNEKGAFVLIEFSPSSPFTTGRMKLSPTGLPGSFTEPVTFTLPFRYGGSNRIGVEYSRSQAKFLITYYDNNSKMHVVTVEDTFSCAIWEDF